MTIDQHRELTGVQAGNAVDTFSYAKRNFQGLRVAQRTLRAAVVPADSLLRGKKYGVFVTTPAHAGGVAGRGEVAVAVEKTGEHEAMVDVDARFDNPSANAKDIGVAVVASAQRMGIDTLVLNPDVTPLSQEVLESIDFKPQGGDSGMYVMDVTHAQPLAHAA